MNERVTLVLAIDPKYELQAEVLITSAARRCSSPVDVIVLGFDVSIRSDLLADLAQNLNSVSVVQCPEAMVSGYRVRAHYAPVSYLRLFLDELLPSHHGRVIYIDADAIVRGDLAELNDFDLGDAPVGAVRDWTAPWFGSPYGLPLWHTLELDPAAPLFNAGVMVLDLDHWRQTGFGTKLREFMAEYGDQTENVDQDPLNICACKRWKLLPASWNVQVQTAFVPGHEYVTLGVAGVKEALASPKIVHFNGVRKPWTSAPSDSDPEWFEVWRVDAQELGWVPIKPQRLPHLRRTRRIVRRLLSRL